jgi:signal transduction histidine kinase
MRFPRLDAALTATYALGAWAVLGNKIAPTWWAVTAMALVAAGLILVRYQPLAAVIVLVAGFWVPPVTVAFIALAPLAYALARVAARDRQRTAAVALGVALTGPLATALPDFAHPGAVFPFSVVLITAWATGYAVGQHRRDSVRTLEQQLEQAHNGIVDERLRIARELHDVVAHSMSVITVQAGYGSLIIDSSPAKARGALQIIETTGRQALDEMRRLLDVLRDEPLLTPSPTLSDVDFLVAQIREAGVRVDLTVSGEPRALPAGVELSAYRILQEALTNVVKHAHSPTARAAITYHPDAVSIEVADDGRGGPIRPGGHGLTGMRERIGLYGGTLTADPLPGRGFRVAARLPVTVPA